MGELQDDLDAALDLPFLFRDRPTSVPSDLRPIWRVTVIPLLICHCRGKRATHERLHVLNWAIRSSESTESLAAYLDGLLPPERAIVRHDPALDRAVGLARGLGLVAWRGRYWVLGAAGDELLQTVLEEDEILARERRLLATLPKPLTQTAVAALLRRGQEAI